MNREPMRSPLGRALGLGSAKDGVEHWWLQRVTAIALVPLTVWFAASLIAHAGNDYAAFIAWLRIAVRDNSNGSPFDCSLLSHGIGSSGRDRGLRSLQNENSSAVVHALWLLCAGRRRYLGDPADRFWRLRVTWCCGARSRMAGTRGVERLPVVEVALMFVKRMLPDRARSTGHNPRRCTAH